MPLFVMQDVKRMLNYAAIAALGEEANTQKGVLRVRLSATPEGGLMTGPSPAFWVSPTFPKQDDPGAQREFLRFISLVCAAWRTPVPCGFLRALHLGQLSTGPKWQVMRGNLACWRGNRCNRLRGWAKRY